MSETVTEPPQEAPAPEAAPVPAAAAVNPVEQKIDAMLSDWVNATIRNSAISQDTPAVSHFNTVALPDLKRRLKEMF